MYLRRHMNGNILTLTALTIAAFSIWFTGQAFAQTQPTARTLYIEQCASCHGFRLEGRTGPALPKAAMTNFGATELAEFIRTTMPPASPGSLSEAESIRLAAYLVDDSGATKAP